MWKLTPLSLTFICIIIYLQSLRGAKSVYTQIWYDTMSRNNGWSTSGEVFFNYDATGVSSNVVKLSHDDNTRAYIARETDVSRYSDLKLQYDLWTRGHGSGDSCDVYYSYTRTSSRTRLHRYQPQTSDRREYSNNVETFSVQDTNTVWIWFEADGSGGFHCYVDDVYLKGIATEAPTTKPTAKPTTKPTKKPTNQPAEEPTHKPTKKPTNDPTKKLTGKPTKEPTIFLPKNQQINLRKHRQTNQQIILQKNQQHKNLVTLLPITR
eukprot:1117341_1